MGKRRIEELSDQELAFEIDKYEEIISDHRRHIEQFGKILSPFRKERLLRKVRDEVLETNSWEDVDECLINFKVHTPIKVSNSLHIHEAIYNVQGTLYRLIYGGEETVPLIQMKKI